MNFLKKIQQWPEERRKIIVWLAVIILGLFLLKFYIANIKKKFRAIEGEKIRQQFQERIRTELKGIQLEEISQPKKQLEELKEYEGK